DPDALTDGYVHVGDDLAYAKTFYPGSPTAAYLNDLSADVHSRVYRNRREERGRFVRFWTEEVPLAVWQSRSAMLVSFLLFWGAFAVGVLSASGDAEFARFMLGDGYVNMTEANIEEGDPFEVYKDERMGDMASYIVWNNIRVSFAVFTGIFFLVGVPAGSFGAAWTLISNGISIGAFFHLFAKEGLTLEWMRVVGIHGVPELSAIVIAGGAALTMWNALLFPGTYPRMTAFRRGAIRGLKIILALLPLWLYAGLLEGFVTRRTEMPLAISLVILIGSGAFVVWYFGILPWIVGRRSEQPLAPEAVPVIAPPSSRG
ncbi:MAG: stage II sporulation protein M, partial [Bacteroidota bacterium]